MKGSWQQQSWLLSVKRWRAWACQAVILPSLARHWERPHPPPLSLVARPSQRESCGGEHSRKRDKFFPLSLVRAMVQPAVFVCEQPIVLIVCTQAWRSWAAAKSFLWQVQFASGGFQSCLARCIR